MENTKTAAPAANSENGTTDGHKDTQKSVGYHEGRILNLLADGGQYSVADIVVALHLSDPRSSIRNLRRKGFAIVDEWHNTVHGGRFKRYFMKGGAL